MSTAENNIPKTSPWQLQMQQGFSKVVELLDHLNLTTDQLQAAGYPVATGKLPFATKVPHSFAARMRTGDPHDPLLLQVLPQNAEFLEFSGFVADPVGDLAKNPLKGLIHKYRSRVLLIATGACAVHCRYCFRREFPYAEQGLSRSDIQAVVDYLQSHPEVNEVILSGGDPFQLSTKKLAEITSRLRALPQIKRLRIHSRTPVVLPSRVDNELAAWLKSLPWPVVIVLHSNHGNEWQDQELQAVTRSLRAHGVTLLNQAVLLRGINDTLSAQIELSEALFAAGVMPYYLNQLDQVRGSAHFLVPDAQAFDLYQQMQAALPGFLVPRFVREQPQAPNKVSLF